MTDNSFTIAGSEVKTGPLQAQNTTGGEPMRLPPFASPTEAS